VLAGAPIDVTIADHDVQPETRAARKGLDELFESLERMAPEDLEFGLERYASYDYDALVTRYVGARLIDDVDHLADRGYRIVRAKRDDEAWQQGLPFVMRAVGAAIIDVILGDRLPPTIATDFDRPFARPVLHVPSIDPFGPADIEADPAFIAAVDKIRA
jgi:hypothetical protein